MSLELKKKNESRLALLRERERDAAGGECSSTATILVQLINSLCLWEERIK